MAQAVAEPAPRAPEGKPKSERARDQHLVRHAAGARIDIGPSLSRKGKHQPPRHDE